MLYIIIALACCLLCWRVVQARMVDHGSDTGSVAIVTNHKWECSGSVVECLTRDRRAAGSSHTSITALCP